MPRPMQSKVLSLEKLVEVAGELRRAGKRLVTTNGCFDLLHWGHLQYLEEARRLGDVLICGINSDSSVRRLKGPDRPLCSEKFRALQVAALEAVDYVALFTEDTPEQFLALVQPHIHVKGGDYRGKALPEQKVVEKGGGKIVCLDLAEGFSTTALLKRLTSL